MIAEIVRRRTDARRRYERLDDGVVENDLAMVKWLT